MNEFDFTNLPRVPGRAYNGAISAFIADVPYITQLQRDFYIAYLSARKAKLFA